MQWFFLVSMPVFAMVLGMFLVWVIFLRPLRREQERTERAIRNVVELFRHHAMATISKAAAERSFEVSRWLDDRQYPCLFSADDGIAVRTSDGMTIASLLISWAIYDRPAGSQRNIPNIVVWRYQGWKTNEPPRIFQLCQLHEALEYIDANIHAVYVRSRSFQ